MQGWRRAGGNIETLTSIMCLIGKNNLTSQTEHLHIKNKLSKGEINLEKQNTYVYSLLAPVSRAECQQVWLARV